MLTHARSILWRVLALVTLNLLHARRLGSQVGSSTDALLVKCCDGASEGSKTRLVQTLCKMAAARQEAEHVCIPD